MRGRCIGVVRSFSLYLPKPSLNDQRSDELRLRQELEAKIGEAPEIPLFILRKISDTLRTEDFKVKVLIAYDGKSWRVIDIKPASSVGPVLGLGIDLGSTSIVFYLLDFETGEIIKRHSFKNPQIPYGEDILTRLHYASKPERRKEIHEITISKISEEIRRFLAPYVPEESLYYIAVCGNTTMEHFFLNLEINHLYREPYIPVASWIDTLKAKDFGLPAYEEALLFVFPNAGSYFGGDLLAGILASGIHQREEISILVDVGTNAELVLGNKDFLLACAGAAGPALEGGILSCGMQASPGAIERVRIDPKTLTIEYQTIQNKTPCGICGSGVIDLLAQMFMAGLVDQRGKFIPSRLPERFRHINNQIAFILVKENETINDKPIYVTEGEIKSIIRSKGAMYTILTVLCQSVGLSFDDIERFYIAGSFGNYIDPDMAVTIGMLPDIPRKRYVSLGNAAGKGTIALLRDTNSFEELRKILKNLTYMEMNVRGEFMNLLTGALFLPHTDLTLFPSVAEKLNLVSRF